MPNTNDFDTVIIQGTEYKVPKAGASPPWGEELADYLKALGEAYSTLVGVGDIPETSAPVANNVAVPTDVAGLVFDPSTVRGADIAYQITRSTDTNSEIEFGTLKIFYDSTLPATEKWTIIRQAGGSSGVDFSMTDAGQLQYTSANLAGVGYEGLIRYEARSILQD